MASRGISSIELPKAWLEKSAFSCEFRATASEVGETRIGPLGVDFGGMHLESNAVRVFVAPAVSQTEPLSRIVVWPAKLRMTDHLVVVHEAQGTDFGALMGAAVGFEHPSFSFRGLKGSGDSRRKMKYWRRVMTASPKKPGRFVIERANFPRLPEDCSFSSVTVEVE